MNIRKLSILLALAPMASACGANTVDLDATSIQVSNEPGVLAIVRERVEKIVVDDQRLFWSGSHLPRDDGGNVWFLHSCQKRACASTLITYDAQPYGIENIFSVNGGQIYWYRANLQALVSCPIAGCNGSPHTLTTELGASAAAFDDDRFYFSDRGSLYRLPLSQPELRQTIASSVGELRQVTIQGAYAYWVGDDFTLPVSSAGERLLFRARKEGSSETEVVANDVRHSYDHAFGVVADTTSIYWTNNRLAGSINRCPVSGCSDGSALVVAPLRAPQSLLLDDSRLYYQHETEPYEYALSSCSLPACAPDNLLMGHLDAPGVLALDEQYLYVATTEQDVSPSNFQENTIARIRRLPKPDQELP